MKQKPERHVVILHDTKKLLAQRKEYLSGIYYLINYMNLVASAARIPDEAQMVLHSIALENASGDFIDEMIKQEADDGRRTVQR